MVKYLKRCLNKWEIVKHKNGIKSDNHIENLLLLTLGGHSPITILQNQKISVERQKRGREIGKTPDELLLWIICPNCGNGRWMRKVQIYHKSFTGWCRKCSNFRNGMIQGRKNRKKEKVGSNGYIEIRISSDNPFYSMAQKSGYVKKHRLIIAKSMKRCLQPWEIVHRKDDDRKNNILSNLALVDKYSHKLGFADAYQQGYRDDYEDAIKNSISKNYEN